MIDLYECSCDQGIKYYTNHDGDYWQESCSRCKGLGYRPKHQPTVSRAVDPKAHKLFMDTLNNLIKEYEDIVKRVTRYREKRLRHSVSAQ